MSAEIESPPVVAIDFSGPLFNETAAVVIGNNSNNNNNGNETSFDINNREVRRSGEPNFVSCSDNCYANFDAGLDCYQERILDKKDQVSANSGVRLISFNRYAASGSRPLSSVFVLGSSKLDDPYVCVLKSVRLLHSAALDAPLSMDDSACDHFFRGKARDFARIRGGGCVGVAPPHHYDADVFRPLNSSYERLFLQRQNGRQLFVPTKVKRALMTLDGCGAKTGIYRVNSSTALLSPSGLFCKRLPKEVLLKVFSYLDIVSLCRCAQVCKYWNLLALDGSNWQRVNLFQFQKDIKGSVVENLAKRCGGFLKVLCLRGCESVQDGALDLITKKCSCIEDLNLEKCKRLTDKCLHSIGAYCKRLKVLNLDCVSLISNAGLKAISDGCPTLRKLNISWCNKIDDNGLAAVAHGCPMLQALICKGCSQVTDDGVKEISRRCGDLRVLNLKNCAFITDSSALYISEGCKLLEYMCLSMCPHITDRSVQYLAAGCQLLKDLELAGCSQLTDAAFNALSKNCHDVERLDLEDCNLVTDNTLCYLAHGCPNLIELSCSHCDLVTDDGVRQLCVGLSVTECLNVLELDNCPLLTDGVLEHLKECRTLKRVELYDCQLITRAAVCRLKQHLPGVAVHAYFAPVHYEQNVPQRVNQSTGCRCCSIM